MVWCKVHLRTFFVQYILYDYITVAQYSSVQMYSFVQGSSFVAWPRYHEAWIVFRCNAPLARRKNNEHEHFDAGRSKSKEDCASLPLFGSHLGPNIKNIGITLGALWVSLDRKSKDAACRVVH